MTTDVYNMASAPRPIPKTFAKSDVSAGKITATIADENKSVQKINPNGERLPPRKRKETLDTANSKNIESSICVTLRNITYCNSLSNNCINTLMLFESFCPFAREYLV